MFLQLSFDLGQLDAEAAGDAARECGAYAVTFLDARDDPVCHPTKSGPTRYASLSAHDKTPDFVGTPVLEPAPGEVRLWPATRVSCLFPEHSDAPALIAALVAALGLEPARIGVEEIGDRLWEREWLRDFHPLRFGRRLWVRPRHEHVDEPDAVVVALDPGLAFGTGTHPSTALCLMWLDAHLAPGARVIDYGCGSGILGIAAAKLGAAVVHANDIDPQALIATGENAAANGVGPRVHAHASDAALPQGVDVLLANILSGPLRALAPRFAALVRPGGTVVLAGLMHGEVAEVTGAYAACFDVAQFAERDGWVCLTARRHGASDADAA